MKRDSLHSENASDYRKIIQVILFSVLFLNIIWLKSISISVGIIVLSFILYTLNIKYTTKESQKKITIQTLIGFVLLLIVFILFRYYRHNQN